MPVPKLVATAVMMAAQVALTALQTTEGPRLTDTKATVADYGTPCNNFIGQRLLPAHCIFAKDIEEKKKKRKGKGGKQVNYVGYATWFVQIAEHPISRVRQIYFDNHLVYDNTGDGAELYPLGDDYDLESSIRIHLGGEDQEPDPDMLAFIEARDGAGTCPAYRHMSGIYFERVPVEMLGNRRPDVKVLVENDSGLASIPTGTEVELTWLQATFEQETNDKARMGLQFMDGYGNSLGATEWAALEATVPSMTFVERSIATVTPSGTAVLRLFMEMDRENGTNNDGYIDAITLTVGGLNVNLNNPGAETGTTAGWNNEVGALDVRGSDPAPSVGDWYFTGGSTAFCRAYQDVLLAEGTGSTLQALLTQVARRGGLDDDEFDFSQATQPIPGYSWVQGTGQQIAEAVCDVFDVDLRPHDFKVQALPRGMESRGSIPSSEFVFDEDGIDKSSPTADEDLPRRVFLTFADIGAGQDPNTAMPVGGPDLGQSGSAGEMSIDMQTLALSVDTAQQLVERRQRRLRFARARTEFGLTRRRQAIEPGDVWTPDFDGDPLTMRITKMTIGADGVIATEWEPDHPRLAAQPGSVGGIAAGYTPPTVPSGVESVGAVLDVPLLIDAHDQTAPLAYVVAGPIGPGAWLGADVAASDTGEFGSFVEGWDGIGSGDGAVFGTTAGALPEALPWVPDTGSVVTIVINAGVLTAASLDELIEQPARNLAAIQSGEGWELVQFMTATLVDDLTYELRGFLRGVRGTEHAIAGHAPGDIFWLLDGTAKLHTMGAAEIGDTDSYIVSSVGVAIDHDAAFTLEYAGVSHKPLSPVHGLLTFDAGTDDCLIAATRRTRVGGATVNGQDVPLGETGEAWEADIYDGATFKRTIAGSTLPLTYTAVQQTTDFGAPLTTGFIIRLHQMSPALSLRGYPLEIIA